MFSACLCKDPVLRQGDSPDALPVVCYDAPSAGSPGWESLASTKGFLFISLCKRSDCPGSLWRNHTPQGSKEPVAIAVWDLQGDAALQGPPK